MVSFFAFRLSRFIFETFFPFLEWLIFKLVFPDGILYRLGKWDYYRSFETKIRQKSKNSSSSTTLSSSKQEKEDHQNPEVVGRKRQRAHAYHRSFSDKAKALSFWREREKQGIIAVNEEDFQDILYLTGKCGEPTVPWQFKLVGEPSLAPFSWFRREFDDAAWNSVTLPNHWQLQGHDIPIYTNTAYPFRFDPPFTVRDGTWSNTLCDLGLGASTKTSSPLHEKEPGPNATALYRRSFSLPAHWESQSESDESQWRYFIVLEGVDCNASLFLNDFFVGYSQDSCLPAEFEVTDTINSSSSESNVIAIMVSRWSDGSYLEDQDKWWLSGIYREIVLFRKPKTIILDYEYQTHQTNSSNYSSYEVRINALIDIHRSHLTNNNNNDHNNNNHSNNNNDNNSEITVEAELWDSKTQRLIARSSSSIVTIVSDSDGKADFPSRKAADAIIDTETADKDIPLPKHTAMTSLSLSLKNDAHNAHNAPALRLWSDESPSLLTLFLTLSVNNKPIQTISSRIGIRSVEIGGMDNTLNVNGKPLVIAGINRHEFDCLTGRAVSRSVMLRDVLLMKSLNFNAVRCSHYPPHPLFLEICAELGLFVIDEANIETHGFQVFGQPVGFLSDQIEWQGAIASRIARMVERDKNCPAVIGWSLGNESGLGLSHYLMKRWLSLRDPMRFVQYESGGARSKATDVICPMYLRPSWCLDQALNDIDKRPVILCEYAHAMGNSGGALEKYWAIFWDEGKGNRNNGNDNRNARRVQGGFIWDFLDQGLAVTSSEESEPKTRFLYGGDFGDMPNTHHFCCNGLLAADRSFYPSAFTVRNLQLPLTLTLHYDYDKKNESHSSLCLRIENKRRFESLDDIDLFCSLKTQSDSELFEPAQVVSSFVLAEKKILAGETRTINLTAFLPQSHSNHDGSNSSSNSDHNHSAGVSCWLEVIVRKRKGSSLWNSDWTDNHSDIELGHFSLQHKQLATHLLNLNNHTNTSKNTPNTTHSTDKTPSPSSTMMMKVDSSSDNNRLIFLLHNDEIRVIVDKLSGQIIEYSHNQNNLLCRPFLPCLFRPPTDNDLGGGDFSYAARWRSSGLDRLTQRLREDSFTWKLDYEKQTCSIHCDLILSPSQHRSESQSEPSQSLSLPPAAIEIPAHVTYLINKDGAIDVEMRVTPPSYLPCLPRCGVSFAVPSSFEKVRWFGLGPHEAYDDRLAGVYLDTFEAEIARDMHTSYICPQENGRRADPRWILLAPAQSSASSSPRLGIVINQQNNRNHDNKSSQCRGYGFNLSHFSVEELAKKKHEFELQRERGEGEDEGLVHVHIDSRMMGVGGYDSWTPNVDEEYLIKAKGEEITTSFRIQIA